MTEAEMITTIKDIVTPHIATFTIAIIERKAESISEMNVSAAVILKNESISEDLIVDLMNQAIENSAEITLVETSKDFNDLKFEIIILRAKIQYLKGN